MLFVVLEPVGTAVRFKGTRRYRIMGVSPHLSSHFFQSSRPRAHDHQVKVIPSAPEGEPAGWAVGLAVLVAAQSAQGHKAIVDTHVYFRLAPAPGAEYAHIY